MPSKQDIRAEMRARRRALSEAQQLQAAIRLAHNLESNRTYRAARDIGVFYAFDGEIDPRVAAEQAWRVHRRTYLPIVPAPGQRRLRFAAYDDGASMVINRFGIPEPDTPPSRWRSPRTLDVVLVPLVAFDVAGHRVGMGGGFYDRSFDYLLRGRWRRPRLSARRPACSRLRYRKR